MPVEPDPPPPEPSARGDYWSTRGDYRQALAGYEEAARGDPVEAGPLNDLAWFLSTCPDATFRNGERAVELATRACELTERKAPHVLDTLAAALAETGDFNGAVETQREAIGLLPKGDSTEKQYRLRIEGYLAGSPFRLEQMKEK